MLFINTLQQLFFDRLFVAYAKFYVFRCDPKSLRIYFEWSIKLITKQNSTISLVVLQDYQCFEYLSITVSPIDYIILLLFKVLRSILYCKLLYFIKP